MKLIQYKEAEQNLSKNIQLIQGAGKTVKPFPGLNLSLDWVLVLKAVLWLVKKAIEYFFNPDGTRKKGFFRWMYAQIFSGLFKAIGGVVKAVNKKN